MNYAAIAGAIRNRDAETAVRLLVLTKQNPTSIESSLDELRRKATPKAVFKLDQPLLGILQNYLASQAILYNREYAEFLHSDTNCSVDKRPPKHYPENLSEADALTAFNLANEAANSLYQDYLNSNAGKTSIWWLPLCDAILYQLRKAAYAADDVILDNPTHAQLKEAHKTLIQFSGNFNMDRRDFKDSKKQGLMFINNHILKLFFRLNAVALCRNVIRTMQLFQNHDVFPAAQAITYNYYLGRLHIIDENYEAAEQALSYAVRRCGTIHGRNLRRLVSLLVPVKMLRGGGIPTAECLKLVPSIAPIVHAIHAGDIQAFNEYMAGHSESLIREGTYFLYEKLKSLAYVRLFKNVHTAFRETETQKLFPIVWIQTALRLMGEDLDIDEIECILANLIARKNVLGYIVHGKGMILSQNTPFRTSV